MNELPIAEADDGIRLDRWFRRHLPGMGQGWIEKNLRKGLIRLDGKKAESGTRLAAGQILRYPQPETAPREPKPRSVTLEQASALRDAVLYKDADIIILNKPPGLAVQGGSGQKTSVDDQLDALLFDAEARPKLVHRLDKETSGVLVLARHAKAADRLMKQFTARQIEKTYLALVHGVPQPRSGRIDAPLAKMPHGKAGYESVWVDESGQRAVSEYRVIEAVGKKLALVELNPITGRTHQLRVHMQAIGHPIVGDDKYGGKQDTGMELPDRLHLHARRVVIPRAGGKPLEVEAPLPEHMRESWIVLGLHNC